MDPTFGFRDTAVSCSPTVILAVSGNGGPKVRHCVYWQHPGIAPGKG